MSTAYQPVGREYLRVSQDRSGRARSIDEQHDDNLRAAGQHGFTLNGEAYSDVSASASRYSRKVRGDFARLLADLEHGRFGADVLVLWESSRGSRRVSEWATLVDLLEDRGVKVHVTTHGRSTHHNQENPASRARPRRSTASSGPSTTATTGCRPCTRSRRPAASRRGHCWVRR